MAEQIKPNNRRLRDEYVSRINRVLDHIDRHIDEELSLEVLADVAGFSRFHFHRIFRAMVGDTLNRWIQRVRVEKATMMLAGQPGKSITDIAFDCGFSGSAAFSRSFREAFGMSPREWRSRSAPDNSKIGKNGGNAWQIRDKNRKDINISLHYNDGGNQNLTWRIHMKQEMKDVKIEVKEMPDLHVAYVRHIGPYQGDSDLFENLWKKLMTWAGPRGLLRFPETKCLSVYHDDPKVTDDSKLRTDVCISVPEDTEVDGEIGKMTVPGGAFAVAHFEIDADQYGEAWDLVMGGWMPESGYQPDDRLSYELCLNNPKEHPEHKHIVDICVPVKPL